MRHVPNIFVLAIVSITRNQGSPPNDNLWLRPAGPNRVSIELRPPIVETNTELGHWEAETVIGKGHHGVLLILVERLTKYVLLVKLAAKNARALAKAALKALRQSGLPVETITFDKGLEFACHQLMGTQLGGATYLAHFYRSWERGLNENTNAGPPVGADRAVYSQALSD